MTTKLVTFEVLLYFFGSCKAIILVQRLQIKCESQGQSIRQSLAVLTTATVTQQGMEDSCAPSSEYGPIT